MRYALAVRSPACSMMLFAALAWLPSSCSSSTKNESSGGASGAGGASGTGGASGASGAAGSTGGSGGTGAVAPDGSAGATSIPVPLAYYSFDDTDSVLRDAVSNLDGSLHGSAGATGQVGQARSFDGVSDYGELPALPPLPELTVSVWVRVGALPSQDVAVFDRWAWSTNQRSFYLGVTDATTAARMMVQGSATGQGQGNPMLKELVAPSNGWAHYAATWDKSKLVFYRDGGAIGSLNAQGALFDASGYPTLIARSRHTVPVHLKVTLDELAVWSEPLSAAQVALVHARGAAGKPVTGE